MQSSDRRWNDVPGSLLFSLGFDVCKPFCCEWASGFVRTRTTEHWFIGLCKKATFGQTFLRHLFDIWTVWTSHTTMQTLNASRFRHDIPGILELEGQSEAVCYRSPSRFSASRCLIHGGRGDVNVLEVSFEDQSIDRRALCSVRSVSLEAERALAAATDGNFGGERQHGWTSQWKLPGGCHN